MTMTVTGNGDLAEQIDKLQKEIHALGGAT
jgi:hypothetical protein